MAEMQQPPMPDMAGANMMEENPMDYMPQEAKDNLMQSDEEIKAVLVSRLANMTPEELQLLDSAITPEVASVLLKLLPELQELIDAISGQTEQMSPEQDMGALGNMMG